MTSATPTIRYDDAAGMVDWLCRVFGFERHLVVDDGQGGIAHAQLVRGSAMIMLGSTRDDDLGRHLGTPRELGRATQSAYIVVDEDQLEALQAQAVREGAGLIRPLDEASHGGRHFSCLDPEGHPWHFGSYDPWRTG